MLFKVPAGPLFRDFLDGLGDLADGAAGVLDDLAVGDLVAETVRVGVGDAGGDIAIFFEEGFEFGVGDLLVGRFG